MLESACCQNYLCLFCAKDLQQREKDVETYYASCPFKCGTSVGVAGTGGGDEQRVKFILSDVPKEAKLKRYSDSQCMSFFSNNLLAGANQSNV